MSFLTNESWPTKSKRPIGRPSGWYPDADETTKKGKMTMKDFMKKVDAYLLNVCGCESIDLPDFDYASAFEAGEYPKVTARKAVTAAGGF